MNRTRIDFYQQQIEVFQNQLTRLRKQHTTASVARLIVFLSMCFSFSWLLIFNLAMGIICGVLLLAGFLALIKYHRKIEEQRDFIAALLKINQNELACCKGDFSVFDHGSEFINTNHPYSYDIDLFGQGSLFQYLNRTISYNGKHKLADWLQLTPLPEDKIRKHQQAIGELSEKIQFRQRFQAAGSQGSLSSSEQLFIKDWFARESFFKRPVTTKVILWLLPSLVLLVFLLSLLNITPWSLFGYAGIINLLIVGYRIKDFNRRNQQLGQAYNELKRIGNLLKEVQDEPFSAPLLIDLKNELFQDNQSACQQIAHLNKLLDALDNRNNIIVGVILNMLLLWDWQCLWRIEKWQRAHQLSFEKWTGSLAYIDALNSLANLAYNNPEYSYPEVKTNEFVFDAVQLGHPLINKDTRVCNDIKLDNNGRFAIVTGANMAGKSTFLRTVAVNLLLAQAGAPVCAVRMAFCPIPLFTSMRAEDSLMKNESYFFAELKRLQNITIQIEKNEEVFIILDEILRGTNSEDKRKGSIGFISKIVRKKVYGLVATHDLELARLAASEPVIFKALCFEVLIENNQLIFNYQLQPGVTQNMNASFLMKQMGIIE